MEHTSAADGLITQGIDRADSALFEVQHNRCDRAYEWLKKARWNNGAAWAHRDSGGRAPRLAEFDQRLQHADDTFRNACFPKGAFLGGRRR